MRWALGLVALAALVFFLWPVPEAIRHPAPAGSVQLTDRHGLPLREVLGPEHISSHAVGLDQISPSLIRATLVSEDRRFYYHPGVDPLAVARAVWLDVQSGELVSGGSTLTQQLVRNLVDIGPRGWRSKLREAFYALRLEASLSKAQILELYLNRVSYGNQALGAEAASRLYFERPALALSPAQAAFLAILPRAPGHYNPYVNLEAILPLQQDLLKRMDLTPEELKLALDEPIEPAFPEGAFRASHFCDFVTSEGLPPGPVTRTTLDWPLQEEVELMLRAHLARLQPQQVTNGAVLVLSVDTGEVLAMAGSVDYAQGQVNAALALRQPGSSLKPFTYALALERGLSPASLVSDIETGSLEDRYLPDNYDRKFHGPVRLREALACSYNVSAVRVLHEVGVDALLLRLRELGFVELTEAPDHYGLGLTLGDGEVTLLELAQAYRCLARGGLFAPSRTLLEQPAPADRRVFDPVTAYLITSILSDKNARVNAFGADSVLNLPFPCAAKTGTSKAYRDNWTVGYTKGYVVAVWVGNFDADPMVDVSGITGAGPLFRDVMLFLHRRGPAEAFSAFPEPAGVNHLTVCTASGERPGSSCPHRMEELFAAGTEPSEECSVHRQPGFEVYRPEYQPWMEDRGLPRPPPAPRLEGKVRIVFPEDGDHFRIDPLLRGEYQSLKLRAVVPEGCRSLTFIVDGQRLSAVTGPFSQRWQLSPGTHRLEAEALGAQGARLRSDPVTITVR